MSIKRRLIDLKADGDLQKNVNFLLTFEKCGVCQNVDTLNKNKELKHGCMINMYNRQVRGLVCNTCHIFERNLRKSVEEEHLSYADLYKRFDVNKVNNTFNNLYSIHGVVPMMVD